MEDASAVEFTSVTPNMLVSEIPVAADYYTKKLGFTVTMDATADNFVVVARGNVSLCILDSKTAAGKSWCGLIVSNPAALFAEYQKAGVTIHLPLETWGDHSEFSILDSDGNRLDIGNPMGE